MEFIDTLLEILSLLIGYFFVVVPSLRTSYDLSISWTRSCAFLKDIVRIFQGLQQNPTEDFENSCKIMKLVSCKPWGRA